MRYMIIDDIDDVYDIRYTVLCMHNMYTVYAIPIL